MEDIIILDTEKTPYINFDYQNGLIELRGKSIPENSIEFYQPLWKWIENLANEPPPEITVNIEFDYVNSSSLKCLIGLFKKLKDLKDKNENTNIKINWYYDAEDEDMLDTGQECEESAGLPFNMIEIEGN